MQYLSHILIFLVSIGAIWFFAGVIVESVDRIARRFNKNGFIIAFFVLGFMTSLSEISVAFNSVVSKAPQVSAGNLVGASFVLLVFVVPLLAVLGKGVRMNKMFDGWRLLLVLLVIGLPAIWFLDGSITRTEGIASLVMYAIMLITLRASLSEKAATKVDKQLTQAQKFHPGIDALKVLVSGGIVLFAGHMLVTEAIFVADLLDAPRSLIGILVLSIGTNIPELAIAARSVLKHRSDIALGNYLGSAAMNTLIFGLLAIFGGSFVVDRSGFLISFVFMSVGFLLLYLFIRSKDILSRKEGLVLLGIYALFIAVQIYTLVQFAVE